MRRRIAVALSALLVLSVACSNSTPSPTPSPSAATHSGTAGGTAGFPASLTRFGRLASVPLITDSPAYKGPATPHSLNDVAMAGYVQNQLKDPKVASTLADQGFIVVPAEYRQFYAAYDGAAYDGRTVYVTTDVAYNAWHLVFDKVLRSLEQEVLLPKLEDLSSQMLAGAQKQAQQLKGTPLAEDASRIEQLMQVEASLLGQPAGQMGSLANQELKLIQAHAQVTDSPITGAKTDYSLYTPRGHYTRTPELTRFFLGMSLLGQSSFEVRKTDQVRMGILAARLLSPKGLGSAQTTDLWKSIYEPTSFLVGTADDYIPYELADAVESVAPGAMGDPTKLTDAQLAEVGKALEDSRPVMIDPENASMRIMGVRFAIDSYVLDQLLFPNVGTEAKPRIVASPLDLASAFGSDLASRIQSDAGQTKYANYEEQMKSMKSLIADRPEKDWGSSVYDSWLWSLEPMWSQHGKAFPDYMRSPEWAAKALQTGFGSYAELKHDTILFAKQSASEGGAPAPKFAPRNWVEPDPVAFERLAAMADLMRTGLSDRDLLTRDADKLMADLVDMYSSFARIADDELAGKPISEADNQDLANIGYALEGLWYRTADSAPNGVSQADTDAAIIADISRADTKVVEVGTGRIDKILVIVPDDHGGFQVAIGGVYSYYEFLQPVSDRLTDEAWRQMLDQGKAPARPSWENVLFGG